MNFLWSDMHGKWLEERFSEIEDLQVQRPRPELAVWSEGVEVDGKGRPIVALKAEQGRSSVFMWLTGEQARELAKVLLESVGGMEQERADREREQKKWEEKTGKRSKRKIEDAG